MTKTKRKASGHVDGHYSFCKWIEGEPEWLDCSKESWPTRAEAETAARRARATHVFKIEKAHPKRVCSDIGVGDFLQDLAIRWDGGGPDSCIRWDEDDVAAIAADVREVLRRHRVMVRGGWRAKAMRRLGRAKR